MLSHNSLVLCHYYWWPWNKSTKGKCSTWSKHVLLVAVISFTFQGPWIVVASRLPNWIQHAASLELICFPNVTVCCCWLIGTRWHMCDHTPAPPHTSVIVTPVNKQILCRKKLSATPQSHNNPHIQQACSVHPPTGALEVLMLSVHRVYYGGKTIS